MDIEQEIKNILFDLVKQIKIHQIDRENSVLEVDYDKHVVEILRLIKRYLDE